MTPRGTTYVTVGSHGFYYRETLSNRDAKPGAPSVTPVPEQPQAASTEDAIASAGSVDLVDSSSERLLQHLNERANRSNPAWILYAAALISLAGLATLPGIPAWPALPDEAYTERSGGAIDEYSVLTARYGEPNSIFYSEADPMAPIPVGTAEYRAEHVRVVFVPKGCVNQYVELMKILGHRSQNPALAKRETKNVGKCLPSADTGWTTVGYTDSSGNNVITAYLATTRLDAIPTRQTADPDISFGSDPGNKRQSPSRSSTNALGPKRPEMKSNAQSRVAADRMRQDIKGSESRLLYSRTALSLGALGLLITGVLTHQKNTENRKTRLFYELDEAEQQKYNRIQQSFGFLSKCHRIWRVEAESGTSDWKRNAGASSLVRRATIGVGTLSPPRVETNVPVPCVNMGPSQLYFFPDTILYRDGLGFGAIAYCDFRIEQGSTRFIEDGQVPLDATLVGQTWRYVNRGGGPDRRFNNNRQLPILQLGVLLLSSSRGLNIQLNTSNPQQSLAFADVWRTLFQSAREPQQQRTHSPPPPHIDEPLDSQAAKARKILGVGESASGTELSAAYRRLAQMYHPDKMAGLAPEFQSLADKRMKEINGAYEVLRGRPLSGS